MHHTDPQLNTTLSQAALERRLAAADNPPRGWSSKRFSASTTRLSSVSKLTIGGSLSAKRKRKRKRNIYPRSARKKK
jgi:hypothetical protein